MTALAEHALQELREVLAALPYDQAIVYEHALDDEEGEERPLWCARFVFDRTGARESWPQSWRPLLPAGEVWLRSDAPWTEDLEALALTEFEDTGIKVAELDGVAQIRQAGLRSLLGVAGSQRGALSVSLVIGARQPGIYGASHRDLIRRPEVTKALSRLLYVVRDQRRRLVRRMREKFAPGVEPEALARDLVNILAEENDWDFVGIYRVDTEFTMFASCDRTPGKVLHLDPHYRQPLDVGMLGETLRQKKCLRADDVDTIPPPHNYSKVDGFQAGSALCYPIIVAGNVEWILDCGSVAKYAFHGPDRQFLDDLVQGLQSTLDLWFETRLSTAVLDVLTEPVLVADQDGLVQRANAAACELFGFSKDALPVRLRDQCFDEDSFAKFVPPRTLHNVDVTLRHPSGARSELLASSTLSSESFGRYVIKFTNKAETEWQAGLRVARQTVEQDLGQARVLLMLAAGLAERVRRDLRNPELFDEADRSLRRVTEVIESADVSYDRVAGALSGHVRLQSQPHALDTLAEWAVNALEGNAVASPDSPAGPTELVDKRLMKAFRSVAEHFVSAMNDSRRSGRVASVGEEAAR